MYFGTVQKYIFIFCIEMVKRAMSPNTFLRFNEMLGCVYCYVFQRDNHWCATLNTYCCLVKFAQKRMTIIRQLSGKLPMDNMIYSVTR